MKAAVNKLTKAYYNAIYHILRIDCSCMDVAAIDSALEPHGLASFERRAFLKLATFGFQMKYAPRAPEELKAALTIRNEQTHNYNLRANTKLYMTTEIGKTKFADRCFKSFFTKLLNKQSDVRELFIKHEPTRTKPFTRTFTSFKTELHLTSKSIIIPYLAVFPNLVVNFNIERTKFILNLRNSCTPLSCSKAKCKLCDWYFTTMIL